MKARIILFITMYFLLGNINAQNQLFKGGNLLMPSNLIVGYAVDLDTCFDLANGPPRIFSSRNIIENKAVKDLFGLILKPVLEGRINCYDVNPWATYQIIEIKKSLPLNDIIENLGGLQTNVFDAKELRAIKFVEEWELTDKPFLFKKNVIAYSPVRYYLKQEDPANFYMQYRIPFTIVDTMQNPIEISKSKQRMQLVSEIAYEYLLYAQLDPPFNVEKAIVGYDSLLVKLNGYFLSRETSGYLSAIAISNFLTILADKIFKGELKATNIHNDQQIKIEDVKVLMGYKETFAESERDEPFQKIVEPEDFDDIKSIIFFEKWYIDSISLRMQKKVHALAPVFHYYDYGNERYARKILFKVHLDMDEK
jgi:hypothetical protein